MRLCPFRTGVETITVFLSQKVVCRFCARLKGSPSVPALAGYLSTSSASSTLMGRLASPVAEFAPTMVMCPPGKFFFMMVFPLYRLFTSTLSRSSGVSRIIGANRSLEKVCPMSKVGCITRIGAGA